MPLTACAGVDPSTLVETIGMMPTVNGKIDPSKFLEDVREMNLPTTKLDMLELKKILMEKSDQVPPQ